MLVNCSFAQQEKFHYFKDNLKYAAVPEMITLQHRGSPQRLDHYLKQYYPQIAFAMLQKWLRTGQIRVNGKRVKGSTLVQENDQLRMPPHLITDNEPTRTATKPHIHVGTLNDLKTRIILNTEHFLALDKPFGLASQGGTGIKDALSFYLNVLCPANPESLRIVHRLDRDTTGVLVLAKSLSASQILSQCIAQRQFNKYYLALLVGEVDQDYGTIDLPLGKLTGYFKEKMSPHASTVTTAVTHYYVIAKRGGLTLICFKPITGRTHQLRVHSTEGLGHSILGDGKYGGRHAYLDGVVDRMHLHAWTAAFDMDDTNYEVTAPLPAHFKNTLQQFNLTIPDFSHIKQLVASTKRSR